MEYHKAEKWGFHGAPLHDPCTIARLLKPEMLYHDRALGWCETREIHSGMTVVDYYSLTGNKLNTTLMVDIDRQAFVDLLAERLAYYSEGLMPPSPLPTGRGSKHWRQRGCPFLLLPLRLMPSSRPSPTGEGANSFAFI